jgi:hypothetical protein
MAVNLCKDCRFYRADRETNPVTGETFGGHFCDRPREKIYSPMTERNFEDLCGKAGRFFEPRAATEAA